ncbi:hypothetical protein ElyMa_000735700 [Elysia marginata]|uniref:Uncharacterized protein n=1 Tax=Elysia marginata TaxID=1093978 RepID=A0AAV4GPY2_9GAST|nr:hypothetical protein ElyMa_000735700 [Elysia marginata]
MVKTAASAVRLRHGSACDTATVNPLKPFSESPPPHLTARKVRRNVDPLEGTAQDDLASAAIGFGGYVFRTVLLGLMKDGQGQELADL